MKENSIFCFEIFQNNLSTPPLMHTKAERSILERASHPFIVQLIYAFQTNTKLFLVLEFAQQGEFFTLLEEEHTLTEDWSKFYLGEIALALGYLHEQHVIYRDLRAGLDLEPRLVVRITAVEQLSTGFGSASKPPLPS